MSYNGCEKCHIGVVLRRHPSRPELRQNMNECLSYSKRSDGNSPQQSLDPMTHLTAVEWPTSQGFPFFPTHPLSFRLRLSCLTVSQSPRWFSPYLSPTVLFSTNFPSVSVHRSPSPRVCLSSTPVSTWRIASAPTRCCLRVLVTMATSSNGYSATGEGTRHARCWPAHASAMGEKR